MKKLFNSELLPNLILLDYGTGSKLTKETFLKTYFHWMENCYDNVKNNTSHFTFKFKY
jgi:hypothetical protein